MLDSSGTSQISSVISFTYTVATINSVTLTPQSSTVDDATKSLLVEFNVGAFALTSDFDIIMTFPSRYSTKESYFPNAITCSNNTANLASPLACSRSITTSKIATVTVDSAFGSTIAATATAGFLITKIKNPISTATISGITLTIVDPTDNSYEIATKTGITMSVSTPKTVSSFSASFDNGNTLEVATATTSSNYLSLSVTPGLYIEASCSLSITLPSDITYNQVVCRSGITTSATYSATNSSVGNALASQCTGDDAGSATHTLVLNITGPASVRQTGSFTFTLKTSGGDSIATGTVALPASSFTTGSISAFSFGYVSGASKIVQTTTEWKLGFTLEHALASSWVITIKFPNSEFSISSCTPANGVGITAASTSWVISGNEITLSGSYTLSKGAKSMTGIVGTNPTSVFTVSDFKMYSYVVDGSNYAVDEYDSSDTTFSGPFTPSIQTLTSVSVVMNDVASDSYTGFSDVQYDFTVVHSSTFPANSKVILTSPSSDCLTMYDTSDVEADSITLSVIPSQLTSSTALTFSYDNFKNPRNTGTSWGNFNIRVTTSGGNDIESGSGGSITVANANTLTTFQITASPTSLTNGQTANYVISSIPNSNTPLKAGDVYYVTFPSEIDISGVICSTITWSKNSLDILFTVPTDSLSPVSLTINNVVVQSSTKPITDAVQVKVVTSGGTSQVISTHQTTTVPTTTTAGTFTSETLTQASYIASATNVLYTFSMVTANKIPVGGVLLVVINIPGVTFTFDSSRGCGSATGSFGACTEDSSANGVVIPITTEIPAGATISFSIGNFTNPSTPTSNSITVTSYVGTSRTYKIDEVKSGLEPSLECDYPWETCSATDRTECLTCFAPGSGITEVYFVEDSNECVNSCASSYSTFSNYTCVPCNSACLTCANNDEDTCLSCDPGEYLYSGDCYTSCSNTPTATYSSGTKCFDWDSDCGTCSVASTNCTSCSTGFLYNYDCITNCPASTYGSANQCLNCNSNCDECSGTATTCTACDSSIPILHLSSCRSDCPSGYIVSSSGDSWDKCTSPCATCSGTVTDCVTCNTNYILDGATCVTDCGDGKVEISGACKTCQGGCKTCTITRTTCTSCSSPLLLHDSSCLSSWPTGYVSNTAGTAWQLDDDDDDSSTDNGTDTDNDTDNDTDTDNNSTTTSSSSSDIPLFYFVFLILAFLLLLLSIAGRAKDPRSLIVTNFIALLGVLEFIFYWVQIFHAYRNDETIILMLTLLALAMLILLNFIFALVFCWLSWRDQSFKYWSGSYCKTKWIIQIVSIFFSFKFMKMLYGRFFGYENFCANWNSPKKLVNTTHVFTIINIFCSVFVCIFADVVGLLYLSWGDQLYVTIVETCILEIAMLIFIIIEFFTTRNYGRNDEYAKVEVEPNSSILQDRENEDFEKKLRADALKRLIDMMKKNKGINNQLEDCINDDDNGRRTRSLPAKSNSRTSTPERPRSYPMSPRGRREYDNPLINPMTLALRDEDAFWEPEDNVYAESKPPDPLGKIGKSYRDGDTQTLTAEQNLFRDDDSDSDRMRNRGKIGRGRGRRGRLEDKIREENDSDELDDSNELDVIKEEEDLVAAGMISDRKQKDKEEEDRRRLEEELRKKIEEEDNQLLEEEKRLATNNSEEDVIKDAEEELSKSKLDPMSSASKMGLDDDERSQDLESEMKDMVPENIDGMFIPPVIDKRSFNENDIKGDVGKRDKEGNNKNVTVLPSGDKVDKLGRKVNDKGYLVDDNGNVIDCKTNKKMFKKGQLDENGNIPQPFKLERYNFNAHDITGACVIGKNGKPIIQETPNGKLVDDSGRQVNENGILIDEEGNVIDKYSRKKIDKDQLTAKGDLPPMLNYDGREYKMQDVMGELDKDDRGDIKLLKDKKGNNVDKKGRKVNNKGYLVDNDGNIVDKKGNPIWEHDHLLDGEFPKIFPFSSFNPGTVTGNFKRDANGNPILKPAAKEGQFYDDDGRLVNKKGYLIDKNGNIIDKKGNLVFKKNILRNGDLPPVFKNGHIRKDSTTSLSRLMSEIDKNQDSDLDILKDQLENLEEDKGNTSVDSLMEDTPSNYMPFANQKYDPSQNAGKYKKAPETQYNEDDEDYYDEGDDQEYEDEEDEDEEDNDSITGPAGVPILNARLPKRKIVRKPKKKRRRRRRKPKTEFEDPNAADIAMARAYGGEARGRPVRKGLKRKKSDKSVTSKMSRGFSKPARRDKFFNIGGGSVTGRNPNDKINTLRSNDSKSKVGKASLMSRKGKTKGAMSKAANSEFEEIYDKNLDNFLENSDLDFESIAPPSRTMSRQGSVKGGNRLKNLESIYLQRLEANPPKSKKKGKKRRGRGPGDIMGSEFSDQDDLDGLIQENYNNMKKNFTKPGGALVKNTPSNSTLPNVFSGNYTKY